MAQPEESFISSRVFASSSKGRPPSTPLQAKSSSIVSDASSALSPAARIRKPQATSPVSGSFGKENSSLHLSRGGTDKDFDLEPPTESIYEIPRSRTAERGAPLLVPPSSASSSSSSLPLVSTTAESSGMVQISKADEMEAIKREQQKRWITVFGFSPAERAVVLQQFRNYGEVTRTVFPPNDSNWMHIQFLNSFQSGSALTKNGMILNGRIMLGVVECTEKSLTEAPATGVVSAPTPAPAPAPSSTLSAVDIMRPQQRSFHAAGRTEYNIERTPEPGPQASQSWWSKIREYVIGV